MRLQEQEHRDTREDTDPEIMMPNGIRFILWSAELEALRGTCETNGRWCIDLPAPQHTPGPDKNLCQRGNQSPRAPQWRRGKQMICFFIPSVLLPLGFLKVWHLHLEAQGPSTFLLDGRDLESRVWPPKPPGVLSRKKSWVLGTEGFPPSC